MESIKKFRNPEHFGRKLNPICLLLGKTIIRKFLSILVDRLMEGDRFVHGNTTMYIGKTVKHKERMVKEHKKKHAKLHTRGAVYSIKLTGFNHRHFFRMPFRRRVELYNRIINGQQYAN